MPIKVNEFAKKMGIESQRVIVVAKELGFSVRSEISKLSDETAKSLEEHLISVGGKKSQQNESVSTFDGELQHYNSSQIAESAVLKDNLHFAVKISGASANAFFRLTGSARISLSLTLESEGKTLDELSFELICSSDKSNRQNFNLKLVDEQTKKLLIGAYYAASSQNENGWVTLAEFGNVLKKLHPTFKPAQWGFPGLSEFIQSLEGIFETKIDTTFAVPVIYIQACAFRQTEKGVLEKRRERGRVLSLKGSYGFIKPDAGDQNFYFHAADLVEPTMEKLNVDDVVTYFAGKNERSAIAKSVRKERES